MSNEKIEQLEELVSLTSEMLRKLRAEKNSLEQRVQELEKDKKVILKENEKAQSSLEKYRLLGVSHRKLEENQSVVRLKVQNALEKIEKMDFF